MRITPSLYETASEYQRMVRFLHEAQEERTEAEAEASRAQENLRLKVRKVADATKREQDTWKALLARRAEEHPEKLQPLEILLADSPEKV